MFDITQISMICAFIAGAYCGWHVAIENAFSDTESDRVAPGYLGDGVSPSHNDKNLHHILTDEEREAVETADAYMSAAGCHNTNVQKTLRGLLERLG